MAADLILISLGSLEIWLSSRQHYSFGKTVYEFWVIGKQVIEDVCFERFRMWLEEIKWPRLYNVAGAVCDVWLACKRTANRPAHTKPADLRGSKKTQGHFVFTLCRSPPKAVHHWQTLSSITVHGVQHLWSWTRNCLKKVTQVYLEGLHAALALSRAQDDSVLL